MPGIADLISGIFNTIGDQAVKVRTAITGKDPALEGQVQILLTQIDAAKQQAQAASDAEQAEIEKTSLGVTGTNFFKFWVAGPRPFILWICGIAFGLQYVALPIANWIGANLPPLDMGVPTQVVLGLLGLGNIAARMVEKVKGAQSNH